MSHTKTAEKLGDFTITPRVLWISGLAMVIGLIASVVALALLRLIGLFTNLFFYQRWSTALVSPANHHWAAGTSWCPWSARWSSD